MIISTVRGRNTLDPNEEDQKSSSTHYLGLLTDYRQVYTSLTRAKCLVIVIGDPTSLCRFGNCRVFWRDYLKQCRDNGSLFPSDFPLEETLVQSQSLFSLVKARRQQVDVSEPFSNNEITEQLDMAAKMLYAEEDSVRIQQWQDEAILKHMESNRGEEEDYFPIPEDEKGDPEDKEPVRCIFRVNYDRQMFAIPVDNLKVNEMIAISTTSQRKTALDGDEVNVVKLGIDLDTEVAYGEVRNIINRAVDMEHRETVCYLDQHSDNRSLLMVPFDQSMPKLNILVQRKQRVERSGKTKLTVPIYRLRPFEKDPQKRQQQRQSPEFVKNVEVSNEDRQNKLFLVQWFKWKSNYTFPLGMVTEELPQGSSSKLALKLLKLAFAVPSGVVETYNPSHILNREKNNRKPVHHKITFTIDPNDAEEYDDAFSIEKSNSTYIVGIHVADVTCFFAKDTKVDWQAKERAMSFYPNNGEPIYMLPRDFIRNLCSLVQGEERLTLSLFLTFDKNGNIRKVERIQKTYMKCSRNICYDDAQKMINSETATRDNIKIRQLYEVANAHRQRRLGLRQFTEYGTQTASSVSYTQVSLMVDELMLIANHEAAKYLTGIEKFSRCTPLRLQPRPIRKDFHDWCKKNRRMFDYSFYLGSEATWLNYEESPTDEGNDQHVGIEDVPILHQVWEELLQKCREDTTMEELAEIICCDSKHPRHAAALRQLYQIMHKSEYRVSTDSLLSQKITHAELSLDVYTHFTSPFRRFIDLVVQRLIHAALSEEEPPYSELDVQEICLYCNTKSGKAKEFERRVRFHDLALEVNKVPMKLLSFIESIGEDDMSVGFSYYPSILSAQQRNVVELQRLKPCKHKQPEISKDETEITVTWNEKIYSAKTADRRRQRASSELKLKSNQYTIGIPGSKWINMLQCIKESDVDKLKTTINQTRKVARKPREDPEVVCFKERSITFERTFSQGEVLQVQLHARLKKGILSSSIGLISITPKVEFCIDHRENPVTSFARFVDEPPDRYDIHAYRDSWMSIIQMETAYQAVQDNETITIHDIDVSWPKPKHKEAFGSFEFRASVCEPNKIRFSLNEESSVKRWYLCIRCPHKDDKVDDKHDDVDSTMFLTKTQKKCTETTVVAHAFIEEVRLVSIRKQETPDPVLQEDKLYKVRFSVHQSPSPPELWPRAATCTVEFIKKPTPNW